MRIAQHVLAIAAIVLLTGCGVGDTGRPAGQGAYPEPQGDTAQRDSYPAPVPATPVGTQPTPEAIAVADASTYTYTYMAPMIGVLVSSSGEALYIAPGSPASETKLQVGDIIEALDDVAVPNNRMYARGRIYETRPDIHKGNNGPPIIMQVQHDGKPQRIPVTPTVPETWDMALPEDVTYPEGSFYL